MNTHIGRYTQVMDVPLVGKNGRKLENEEDLGRNVEAGNPGNDPVDRFDIVECQTKPQQMWHDSGRVLGYHVDLIGGQTWRNAIASVLRTDSVTEV